MKSRVLAICLLILNVSFVFGQSYRGLSVVNDQLAWVSGYKGTVLRTKNGGKSWDTLNPAGFGRKDFRDIHAWDENHAITMSAGDTSVLLETRDGGKSWTLIYSDSTRGSFFDAIDVRNNCIVLTGDGVPPHNPYVIYIDNKRKIHQFSVYHFSNKKDLWYWGAKTDTFSFFAASGSNVKWISDRQFVMIPVGRDSSYYLQFKVTRRNPASEVNPEYKKTAFITIEGISALPFPKQKAGGAYGMHVSGKNTVVAGGSFYKANTSDNVAFLTSDGGKTWQPAASMPGGYRSGVCADKKGKIWICTGPNGTDISTDAGKNWKPLDKQGYHVCAAGKNTIWMAGKEIRVMQMTELKNQD